MQIVFGLKISAEYEYKYDNTELVAHNDKDQIPKTPIISYIFEKEVTQGYQI